MKTEFETTILKNGLCVKTLKNSYLHSVTIGIYVKKLPESIRGIAHLVEHLFFRRLADIPQDRLYFQTDRLGASLKATTYADFICFNITVSPSRFKEAICLISKIFNNFEWTSQEILAEKEVVKRQIEERYESLYTKADLLYYRGTAKGNLLMGRTSDVDKMSAKRIHEYKNNVFIPQNACVVLTGNFSKDNLLYCLNLLNNIPVGKQNNDIPSLVFLVNDFAKRTEYADRILYSLDLFSDVCISFDVDERRVDRYAAEFLFSILGYGVTSKISQRLREQKGWINELNGGIEFSNYAGRMTFEYEIHTKNLNESLLEVFEILTQVKDKLSELEYERNKMFYTENQYQLLDNVRELNFLIGWRGFIESEQIESMDDLIGRYNRVTIEKIMLAAKEILKPQNLIITISNHDKRSLKTKETLKKCRKKLEV